MNNIQDNHGNETNLHTLAMAILTGSTCGFACWQAEEDVCRCSCGGRNHGIMKVNGGKIPERTCKIDGYFYVLDSIDNGQRAEGVESGYAKARRINSYENVGYKHVSAYYSYTWEETDKGAPARYKSASESQMKWTELKPFVDEERPWRKPYLVWLRDDNLDPARREHPIFVRGKKVSK